MKYFEFEEVPTFSDRRDWPSDMCVTNHSGAEWTLPRYHSPVLAHVTAANALRNAGQLFDIYVSTAHDVEPVIQTLKEMSEQMNLPSIKVPGTRVVLYMDANELRIIVEWDVFTPMTTDAPEIIITLLNTANTCFSESYTLTINGSLDHLNLPDLNHVPSGIRCTAKQLISLPDAPKRIHVIGLDVDMEAIAVRTNTWKSTCDVLTVWDDYAHIPIRARQVYVNVLGDEEEGLHIHQLLANRPQTIIIQSDFSLPRFCGRPIMTDVDATIVVDSDDRLSSLRTQLQSYPHVNIIRQPVL